MSKYEAAVFAFMYRHGLLPRFINPKIHPPIDIRLERVKMLIEELAELTAAMSEEQPIHEVADALGDLFYVLVGTFVAYGIPIDPVFDEIHRSNMTKEVSLDVNVKPVKGAEYQPPRLQETLASWRTKTNSKAQ